MSHPNAELIARFYAALGNRDGDTMAACYADDACFSDPVFPDLDGNGVRQMWRMLCARASDLQITVSDIVADDTDGSARWIATYTFARTGRRVRNIIDARFRFRDGRIICHIDRFDLWRWTAMALGAKGRLLGWTPPVRNAIRREAARSLQHWRQHHPD